MNIQVKVMSAQAQARIRELESEIARLRAQMGAASAATNGFGAATQRNVSNLGKWGNQLQWAGRQLTYNFTVPIGIAAGAAAKFALDNEKAFTSVKKVYGDVGQDQQVLTNELNALRGAFVALSNEYGVQQSEVIQVGAAWAAAGSSGLALAKGVDATLKAMILGELDAATATQALIAIQSQYRLSSEELADTIGILNIVENQTGVTMGDLIVGLSRTAGVARNAGIDVQHLAAMMAALVPAAGTAAQAGNALKTIVSRLLSPTKEAADILKAMGIHTESMAWKSQNATQRLEMLAKKFDGLSDSQKAVVSATLASRFQINKFDVLMEALNGKLDSYYTRANRAVEQTDYMKQAQKELNTVLESSPQRLKQIGTILQNSLADIIQPLIPVILMLAQSVVTLVQKFQDLDPNLQKLIGFGVLFLALLGPIARYVGSVAQLFSLLGRSARFLGGSLFGIGKPAAEGAKKIGFLSRTTTGLKGAFGTALMAVKNFGFGLALMAGGFVSKAITSITKLSWAVGGPFFKQAGRVAIAAFALMGRNLVQIWGGTIGLIRVLTSTGMGAVAATFSAVTRALQVTFTVLFSNLAAIFTRGGGLLIAGFRSIFLSLGTAAVGGLMMLPRLFAGAWVAVRAVSMAKLAALGRGIIALVAAWGPRLIAVFTGPWGWAIAAVVTVLFIFRKQIRQVIDNVIAYFQNLPPGVAAAFAPITSFFGNIIQWIINAFHKLPAGVQDAVLAVVRVVSNAALQVYEWFSYLNPFAHHSPSLVENVTKGMKAVRDEFAKLNEVEKPIKKAYKDLQDFARATAAFKEGLDKATRVKQLKDIVAFAPGAADEFKKLVKDLIPMKAQLQQLDDAIKKQKGVVEEWQDKLDKASKVVDDANERLSALRDTATDLSNQLDNAKDRLDGFANTPIEGMKAMNDAIFANQMAQKQLQLQLLNMGDGGSIDKLRSNLDELQGQIEQLRGEQASLRAGGAGSEILGAYQDQIDALRGQQTVIEAQAAPIQAMNDQLAALQLAGEKLDLENSIKFDPLTKQIDDLANGLNELPFDEIIAGINSSKAEVDQLTAAYEAANKAVVDQEAVVKAAEVARDAIQAKYDIEKQKLDTLQTSYDNLRDSISDVETALNDMATAASQALAEAQAAAEATSPALQNFNDAAGGNFPDVGGNSQVGREGGMEDQSKAIEEYTRQKAEELGKMLGGFDVFKPVRDAWQNAVDWISSTFGPAYQVIADGIGQIFSGIDWGAPFEGYDFGSVKSAFEDVSNSISKTVGFVAEWAGKLAHLFGPDVKEGIATVKAVFQDMWDSLQPKLAQFGDLIAPLGEAFGHVWAVLRPILAFIAGAVVAMFEVMVEVWNNTARPVFSTIADVIGGALDVIHGVISFILDLINGDFSKLWGDVTQIIGGMWGAVVAIFKGIPQILLGIIRGLVEGIFDFFHWLWDELVGHSIIPDLINDIIDWFTKLPGRLLTLIGNLVTALIGWFASLPQKIWDALIFLGQKLWDLAQVVFTKFKDAFVAAWPVVIGFIISIPGLIIEGLITLGQKLWDFATTAFTTFLTAFQTAWPTISAWLVTIPQLAWDAIYGLVTKLGELALEAFAWFLTKQKEGWGIIISWLITLPGKVWDKIIAIKDKVGEVARQAFGFFKTKGVEAWGNVVEWLKELPGKVWDKIIDIKDKVGEVGKRAFEALKSKASEKWGDILEWAKGLPGAIADKFTDIKTKITSKVSGMWDGIKEAFKNAMNWIIRKWNALHIKVGGWKVDTIFGDYTFPTLNVGMPPIPEFAKGGVTSGPTLAGEGRHPEYVIPLDPAYRSQALSLFAGLEKELFGTSRRDGADIVKSAAMAARNAARSTRVDAARVRTGSGTATASMTVQPGPTGGGNEYHFHGDLSFPNIKSGGDAKEFVANLKSLKGNG
jgi:TP901 family phage tail tape measure protein